MQFDPTCIPSWMVKVGTFWRLDKLPVMRSGHFLLQLCQYVLHGVLSLPICKKTKFLWFNLFHLQVYKSCFADKQSLSLQNGLWISHYHKYEKCHDMKLSRLLLSNKVWIKYIQLFPSQKSTLNLIRNNRHLKLSPIVKLKRKNTVISTFYMSQHALHKDIYKMKACEKL